MSSSHVPLEISLRFQHSRANLAHDRLPLCSSMLLTKVAIEQNFGFEGLLLGADGAVKSLRLLLWTRFIAGIVKLRFRRSSSSLTFIFWIFFFYLLAADEFLDFD
jgi:hypothetical protein